ncbi:hypothetical protein KJ641_00490 [Patescibacteria group bacterium]|nr:hypothetical protein [Patescibacteria group bacterium]
MGIVTNTEWKDQEILWLSQTVFYALDALSVAREWREQEEVFEQQMSEINDILEETEITLEYAQEVERLIREECGLTDPPPPLTMEDLEVPLQTEPEPYNGPNPYEMAMLITEEYILQLEAYVIARQEGRDPYQEHMDAFWGEFIAPEMERRRLEEGTGSNPTP